MKRFLLVLAALAMGATAPAMAQNAQQQGARGGPGGQRMMATLLEGITLTAEQSARIDSLAAVHAEARRVVMENETDPQARRTVIRELMTQQTDQIKSLLTDEQKKIFEKNLAQLEARRRP